MPISSITLPNSLKVVSFVVHLFYQLVLSSTLTLPNSTFGYIHTVFVWWAPFSHSYTIWTKRKHLTRNSFSDAFFRLAYSHTFWNPLIYYSMNAKVKNLKENIMKKSKAIAYQFLNFYFMKIGRVTAVWNLGKQFVLNDT